MRIALIFVTIATFMFYSAGWCSANIPGSVNGYIDASKGLPTKGIYDGVSFGDVNNDGYLDIGVTKYREGVSVWIGDGTGVWKPASNGLPTDDFDGGVCFGDINNDGNLDIVFGSYASKYGGGNKGFAVYTGNGAGIWTNASTGLPTTGSFNGVCVGDINNDGNLDIGAASGVAHAVGAGVRVFTGNGGGKWQNASTGLPTSGNYYGIWFGDINNDNNLDLVVAGDGVHVFRGDGTGKWIEASTGLPTTGKYMGAFFGRIDSDNYLDLVITSGYTGSLGIQAFRGNGAGTWTSVSKGLPSSGEYMGVYMADITKDGYIDIITAGYGGQGIRIWSGDGGNSWKDSSANLPHSGRYLGIWIGDIDNNGYLDIAASNFNGVQVWKDDHPIPEFSISMLSVVVCTALFVIFYRNKNKSRLLPKD